MWNAYLTSIGSYASFAPWGVVVSVEVRFYNVDSPWLGFPDFRCLEWCFILRSVLDFELGFDLYGPFTWDWFPWGPFSFVELFLIPSLLFASPIVGSDLNGHMLTVNVEGHAMQGQVVVVVASRMT